MRSGRRIMRLLMPCIAVVVFASAARAEPASIRCQDKDAYFVTYDIATNRVISESPSGGLVKGEIARATDQRLELRLNARGGPIPLLFDRQAKVMHWPGAPGNKSVLAPLTHACTTTADRTVLSLFGGPEQLARRTPVDAFSIRCHGASRDFFITMDRSTKAVVMETEAGDRYSGGIDRVDGAKISFAAGAAGETQFSGTWNEQTQELSGNDPSHPPHSQHCIPEKARSIMEVYDRL